MGSKIGVEEIRHIYSPEELLRFLKNMRFLSEFSIAWNLNTNGDFESASLVRKSGVPNEWLLKKSEYSDFKRMTTEELATDIILRKHNYGAIGLFEDMIAYYLTGSEWDEIIFRSIKHEIHSYAEFMDRNPIYYQEEYDEEEQS